MFKFNISEEIIFNIKSGKFKNNVSVFKDQCLYNKFLNKIYMDRFLTIIGCTHDLRDRVCIEIIYSIFYDNYGEYDISVFKVGCVDEIDEVYLEDEFQIFYLNDFFGKINFKFDKFKYYFHKIINSKNKFLVLNIRDFDVEKICDPGFYENLDNYVDYILENSNNNYNKDISILEYKYFNLSYIDKFVLFSLFFYCVDDVYVWIKMIGRYFLNKNVFDRDGDFNELIMESFKKLEDDFIFICSDGKFVVENLVVEEFLFDKLKNEIEIIKDILNNISSYFNLKNFIYKLKTLDIKIKYSLDEYEENLKCNLFEIICTDNSKSYVDILKFALDLFNIININDDSILKNLITKIIYSDIDIDKSIEYFCFIKNYKTFLIENDIFKDKLFKLIYNYKCFRNFEFYRYSFKYFLFVSEFQNLYGSIDKEEFLDIEKSFNRLIDIILNNINSYFTLEYFSLNNEIKQALIDLRFLIYNFGVKNIFLENVYEIFNNIKEMLFELFNNAVEFIPKNKQEYYILTYFENEIEKNKDFIEVIFENTNLDNVFQEIRKNICEFEA